MRYQKDHLPLRFVCSIGGLSWCLNGGLALWMEAQYYLSILATVFLTNLQCDEAKPVCGGCSRHHVTCTYDHLPRPGDRTTAEDSETSVASSSRSKHTEPNTNAAETKKRRLLELKLMHHWTLNTCLTFPLSADPSVRDINTTILPNLGLQNEALLYCIFFLAALHLVKTEAYSTEAAEAYQNYLDLTIRSHRIDVTNLSSSNADIVYLTASLLRLGSFAILPDRNLVPYTPPSQWMHMNQGSGAVHRATWPWIGDNPASIANRAVVQKTPDLTDFKTLFQISNRQSLLHLLTNPQGITPELWSPDIQEAYERSLSFIGAIQVALDEGIEGPSEILRRCLGFPGIIPKRFFDMVEERRPRALVILAYYFAYLARFKDIWWIGDAGAREVRAIAGVLRPEWGEMMGWPVGEVERIYS